MLYFTFWNSVNNIRSISTKACACLNQGVCDSSTGLCICPSGYSGQQCERLECDMIVFWFFFVSEFVFFSAPALCNDITCKNAGVCNVISPTESACWCLLGNKKKHLYL